MSEEAKQQIEELINAVGAMCEMAGLMREELLRKGFTRKEVFLVCKEFIMRTLASSSFMKNEGE